MTRRILLVLAACVLALPAGCRREPRPFNPEGLAGPKVSPPIPKPAFTLTDTEGKSFDFRRDTEGYVALLFVGYTNCPDVCPVHMANIAASMHKLAPEVTRRIKVVFVTADPERDTPPVIRKWLDQFDPSFIGLRGDSTAVQQILASLHLGTPVREPGTTPGTYTLGHSSLVIAFTTDNMAHVIYPFGVRQADWSHDLVQLVKGSDG
jgi:protein SCO1